MRLCMFHPRDRPMERGWVGRVDGDRVIHLAAQTLQHFFTGGASAREHDEYPLAKVKLLTPVHHPPSVRVFSRDRSFEFANPAAVVGPDATVVVPGEGVVTVLPRLVALVADGGIAGFSCFLELRARELPAPKDRDFGLSLGPVVVTPDELDWATVTVRVNAPGQALVGRGLRNDWNRALYVAAAGTVLRTGDLLAGPSLGWLERVRRGATIEMNVEGIGELAVTLA